LDKLKKRIVFVHINKYQKDLLYPILVSCFLGCLIALLALDYFYFDQSALICNFNLSHLKMLFVWFLPIVAFFLFVVGFQVYLLSNKIVGPCNRIVKELDQLLSGKGKKHLRVRQGDEMFRELTERINELIDKLP